MPVKHLSTMLSQSTNHWAPPLIQNEAAGAAQSVARVRYDNCNKNHKICCFVSSSLHFMSEIGKKCSQSIVFSSRIRLFDSIAHSLNWNSTVILLIINSHISKESLRKDTFCNCLVQFASNIGPWFFDRAVKVSGESSNKRQRMWEAFIVKSIPQLDLIMS